ncbi:thioredoxin [Candidatus Woesebacteria bacterium]|nr:thioredoxin [Candidatus Woesebacteria bacterium]
MSDDKKGVLHLTQEDFAKVLADAGDKPVLVDFYAEWCGPCKLAAPVIEELGEEYAGKAVIAKVDVDDQNALASEHGVMSIPTVIVFHKGEEVDRKIGFAGKEGYVGMIEGSMSEGGDN